MRGIKNRNLAQLLMQLRFAPRQQRRKQLDSAEKLMAIINTEQEYPFEFVCFHITGFRPKEPVAGEPVKGDELAADLGIFISKLSGQIAPRAGEQGQRVYTIDGLADVFDVSTKTIGRWRKRGLVARKFVSDDGKKRLGFLQSTVDNFVKKNPKLVAKAKNFKRLTDEEKQQIIKQAGKLATGAKMSRYQIIESIAAQIGAAHETVRYTISEYEKANPDKPIASHPPGVITPTQAAELYKQFNQGSNIGELTKHFGRSKSSVYRIINVRRAKTLLARKIEFIASDEFLEEDAGEKILAESVKASKPVRRKSGESFKMADGSLEKYLEALKNTPVLNREHEVELFRRYNYLKYLACIARAGMKPVRVLSSKLSRIEKCLAEAELIKNMIIEANLRLVVSIASKHTTSGANLLDLVSEGNVSLMRAVEKFDYMRGVRFATYASWIIAKDYARKIPAEEARFDRTTGTSVAELHQDLRTVAAADIVAVERAHQSLVHVIRDNLNEREQYIILNHFGLLGSLIRKKKKTLQQIGIELNLSKERVRQIELVALQKLRISLSIEQFELLTG